MTWSSLVGVGCGAAQRRVALLLGTAGSLALAFGLWSAGAFPVTRQNHTWLTWTGLPVPPRAIGLGAWWSGLTFLVAAWLLLRRHAHGQPRVAVLAACLWITPLFFVPPAGSRDVYSYAAHGELRSLGLDPGAVVPLQLPAHPDYRVAVFPRWRTVVSAYGPGHVLIAWATTRLAADHLVATVIWWRAVTAVGIAAIGALMASLARRRGIDTADALLISLGNPILIVHGFGGPHNEIVMLALALAGIAAAERWPTSRGRVAGAMLVGLGASVKLPAIAAIVVLAWAPLGSPRRRLVRLGALTAVAVATVALVGLSAGVGWGWFTKGLRAAGAVPSPLGITYALGWAGATGIGLVGTSRTRVIQVVQDLGVVVSAALAVRALWPIRRDGVRTLGTALLVVALLGPAAHPWYLLWALPFFALSRVPEDGYVGLCAVAVAVNNASGGGLIQNKTVNSVVVIVAAPALWWALTQSRRRWPWTSASVARDGCSPEERGRYGQGEQHGDRLAVVAEPDGVRAVVAPANIGDESEDEGDGSRPEEEDGPLPEH
jgi:hypothetical protein